MPEITDLMDPLFASRTLAEWGALFDEHGFTWGPASTVAEVAADPHAAAVGLFPEVEHPVAGRFRTVAGPVRIRGADIRPRGAAPDVGQDTAEVLGELGLSDDEVAALAADGVVGLPPAP
jgi:crotonobetainyl-CoA:carnitine CoA-transferase CaiB-like acyl-CoA transferase